MPDDTPSSKPYDIVLFKLSGELLGGDQGVGYDPAELDRVAEELARVANAGVRTAIVVGGGNFFRGGENQNLSISDIRAHQMGMLFTISNAIALEQALHSKGIDAIVQSSVSIPSIVPQFDGVSFARHLSGGGVLIFAGGTGCTHFTTDTAASLRAVEIGADILLKVTDVDGIYSSDPASDRNAKMYELLTHDEVLENSLAVMDAASVALCREHRMPIRVFNGSRPGSIFEAGLGSKEGTLVTTEER